MHDDEIQGFVVAAAVAYLGANIFVAWSVVGLGWEACASFLGKGIGAVVALAAVWIVCGVFEKSRLCFFTSSVLAATWFCWWPAIKKSAETAPCFEDICSNYGLQWWGQAYIGVGAFLLILVVSILSIRAWEDRY